MLFDDAVEGAGDAAEKVSGAILDLCIEHGGSITGEHGVGMDKAAYMPRMYTDEDLDTMQLVRCAFDPQSISNPGKVFPTPRLCGEVPGRKKGAHPAPGSRTGGGLLMKGAATLDRTAREAIGSACAGVRDPGPADHVDGVVPGVVARPADTGQVAEVLRAAAAHGLSVIPRGRGTKLSWALPPRSADVLLDLSSLDQVVDHAAGDLIVVTQAGARLAELQEVVGRGGQRLALDETVSGASIGGTLATNASGPHRVATGTARDLLIGITVVRADGVVAKAGGKVVKNVAGYDLGKLIIGSFGTLAVDHRSRLPAASAAGGQPMGERSRSPTRRRPRSLVLAVLHGQAVPAAVEVEWPSDGPGAVHVLLEGREDGVQGRADTVRSLLGRRVGRVRRRPGRRSDVPLGHRAHRRRPGDLPEAHLRALRSRRRARDRA